MDGSNIEFVEVQIFYFDDENSFNTDFVKRIAYFDRRYMFNYQMTELAAFCEFSIPTDTGINWLNYLSQTKPVELKSQIYFFNSLRNVWFYKEYSKSWICNDLNLLLDYEGLLSKTQYSTWGEIETTCTNNSNE